MFLIRRVALLLLGVSVTMLVLSGCEGSSVGNSSGIINVVAAENFYGDVVKQIGGDHVKVTSILSDPNVDPHVYESNVNNAKAVAKAQLVIQNGGGYDDWMDKLLTASPDNSRIVLKGFDLATKKLEDNEHVWYSIDNMQAIAQNIKDRLKKLDASHSSSFDSNFQTFKSALDQVRQKQDEIKSTYNNAPVALTETIFLYQTDTLGLKVLTPFDFQKAIAEENDPPANAVVTAENQVKNKEVKVVIYNEQNASAITQKLQNDAKAQNIPVVPVTETMPTSKTYQSWMLDQLNNLEQSLGK